MKHSIFMLAHLRVGGLLDWLQQHLLRCPIKQNFGMDCPGCGLQRSILALCRGQFIDSFQLYPPTIPFLALFVFTMIHLKVDFKFGALTIKILFIIVVLFVVINYIYKINHHQLFN